MSQLVLYNPQKRRKEERTTQQPIPIPQLTTRTFHHFEFDEILVAPT